MALPKEKFDHLFHHIPELDKKSLLDYMEYLIERAARKAWSEIPEIDESFTKEEKEQLARAKRDETYIALEELKRELNL
jgi:hypothetical protein